MKNNRWPNMESWIGDPNKGFWIGIGIASGIWALIYLLINIFWECL